MKTAGWTVGAVCLLMLVSLTFMGAAPSEQSKVERGKYLVHGVAGCSDCHTPTNEKGEPLPGKELTGAPLLFKPTVPVPNWAEKAPKIAGLPGWDTSDAVKFLMTGVAFNGLPARPPMPQYRMNKEDAEAVVAYLRSLTPADK
jgi:mono/diheme cytochrome c family protein